MLCEYKHRYSHKKTAFNVVNLVNKKIAKKGIKLRVYKCKCKYFHLTKQQKRNSKNGK